MIMLKPGEKVTCDGCGEVIDHAAQEDGASCYRHPENGNLFLCECCMEDWREKREVDDE